jgi:hypothetical protein
VEVASRRPAPPALLAEGLQLLALPEARWFIQCGVFARTHSRAAFFVFAPTSREPSWVVKFARVPGLKRIFDEDERGLRLAARLGPFVADHAPRLVGRFEACELHASVETAAVGERMAGFLRSARPRGERLAALERVADWALEAARRTRTGTEALEPERRRLAREIVARWDGPSIPPGLVESLRTVPAVFEHDDLWADNIFVRDGGFVTVDWESAREHGLPLWDLLHLLTDGLALLDHVSGEVQRDEYIVALCRGDLASSTILFRWLRRAVEALSVPAEAVGPLAVLWWLDRAAAEDRQGAERLHIEPAGRTGPGSFRRLTVRWLTEPGLRLDWSAWRR